MTSAVLLSQEAGRALLSLARHAIERFLSNQSGEVDRPPHPELMRPFGLFVTLKKKDALRGCIGQLWPDAPVFRLVEDLAVSSASRDLRFPPLRSHEWPDIEIEVSVLSPLVRMKDISELKIGTHGILLKRDALSGVYLPEVAVESGWDAEQFLSHCAREKAGLADGDWKSCEVYLFTTQAFKEAPR
jgi:AmmeMemoRadiSam system protein A